MRRNVVTSALFALGLASAGNALAEGAPDTCEYLNDKADNHTCQHGYLGPFASVGSASYPDGTLTTNVSTTHILYTVALSGDAGDNRSAVAFEPPTSGTYSFYMNEAYPLELLDSKGQAVAVRLENDVPACPQYLGWFQVYENLESGESYTLVLGPTEEAFVQVVSEALGAFPDTLYVDADGDGFGVEQSVNSWCGVASGYSNMPGDCSDDAQDISPAALESCNGIDDDCDGEVDETGDALCEGGGTCEGNEGCSVPPGGSCSSPDCGHGGSATATGGSSSVDPGEGPLAGNGGQSLAPDERLESRDDGAGCSCRQTARDADDPAWVLWLLAGAVAWARRVRALSPSRRAHS
jgi:hypothetical protein